MWPFPYGIILAADRLSATMLFLSAAIVGASAVFSLTYLSDDQQREVFHPLLHFLLVGIQASLNRHQRKIWPANSYRGRRETLAQSSEERGKSIRPIVGFLVLFKSCARCRLLAQPGPSLGCA